MIATRLVQPLFDGTVDIVADVHGEIDAVRELMLRLGYANDGLHPEGRRLVFLGDLTDGGPNSPAVVRLVSRLVSEGLAQCILGNHELSILQGLEKKSAGNHWFFGNHPPANGRGKLQALADRRTRAEVLRLFRRLPMVLERSDLRIVHACWDAGAAAWARKVGEGVATDLFAREEQRIDGEMATFARDGDPRRLLGVFGWDLARTAGIFLTREEHASADEGVILRLLCERLADPTGRNLARQNWNPVKLLTSGPERRLQVSNRLGKSEGRAPWWLDYRDEVWCVVGHYSRRPMAKFSSDHLFDDARPFAALGNGRAMCIDYSVAGRWSERPLAPGQTYRSSLAALRWPERVLFFDNAEPVPVGDS
jgi:hypothetical protein